MKDKIADENDENETGEVKPQKPVPVTEKTPLVKASKPTKPSSIPLTLRQALQNVSSKDFDQHIFSIFVDQR
jgi:hypothetical protein